MSVCSVDTKKIGIFLNINKQTKRIGMEAIFIRSKSVNSNDALISYPLIGLTDFLYQSSAYQYVLKKTGLSGSDV